MKTVILCGGKGTRLIEKTELIPKPLVEIGSKPILWHLMKIYSHYGYNDFILCLGYKGEKIIEYFKKNPEKGWKIEFADTGLETNTGGRIKKIEKYVDSDDFFCTYADGLSDLNLKSLYEFHKKKNKVATITAVNPLSQFGILDLNSEDEIIEFEEKPKLDHWINGGFFVFKREIFDYLTEEDFLEKRPFELLAKERKITAYKFKGFWKCMDTYKDNQVMNDLWESKKAPWKV